MPTLQEWGVLQIIVGGEDVTYYRGVACVPKNWSYNEPFSDATAEIHFPQVSGFEPLPSFMAAQHEAPDVDIWLVRADDSQKVLWEGMVAAFRVTEDGVTLECIGALYQLDLYKKKPSFRTELRDVQEVIAQEFIFAPSMRTGPPSYVEGGGMFTRQRGAWNAALTGYVQDLLAQAQFPTGLNPDGTQLTLVKEEGRVPSLGLKDMESVHWTASFGTPGIDVELTRDRLAESNVYYGEGVDHEDHCRWRGTVYPTDLDDDYAFFIPLAWGSAAEPYVYGPDRQITGANPAYDPTLPRIEEYTHYGEGITFEQGTETALRQLGQTLTEGWYGTITMTADADLGPDATEGASRFEMRENRNIRIDNFQGGSVLLHIVRVEVDWESQTVALTVDSKARDIMTLSQIMQKTASDSIDPAKRFRQYRNSRNVEDRIHIFDCDAGGGVIPATALAANTWTVLRVPFGEYGQIVRSDLTCTPAARFSVGVFDRVMSPSALEAAMPLGPLAFAASGKNPWDELDSSYGLIAAWGGPEQAAGYWPGQESDETPVVTGRLVDDAIWSYGTPTPPWLWVAFWSETATSISGRFYPGVEGFS